MKRYETQLKNLGKLLLVNYGIGFVGAIVLAILIKDKNILNIIFELVFFGFLFGSIITVVRMNTKGVETAGIASFKILSSLIKFPSFSFSSIFSGFQFVKIVVSIFLLIGIVLFEIVATPVTIIYIIVMYFIEKKKEISESLADTLDKVIPVIGAIITIIMIFALLNGTSSKPTVGENKPSVNNIESSSDSIVPQKTEESIKENPEPVIEEKEDITVEPVDNSNLGVIALNDIDDISVEIVDSSYITVDEEVYAEYIINVNIDDNSSELAYRTWAGWAGYYYDSEALYSDIAYRLLDMDGDGQKEIIINLTGPEKDYMGFVLGELVVLGMTSDGIAEIPFESIAGRNNEGVAISNGVLYVRQFLEGGEEGLTGDDPSYSYYTIENGQVVWNYGGLEEPENPDWF